MEDNHITIDIEKLTNNINIDQDENADNEHITEQNDVTGEHNTNTHTVESIEINNSTDTSNSNLAYCKSSRNRRIKFSLEQTLKKMRKYRWLHKRASEYYDSYNNYLTAPTIFIAAIATVLSIAEINPLILATVTGLSTTLIGLSTYLKLGCKHMNHLVAAEGYDNLVTMIDFEIKFPDQKIKKFAGDIEKKVLEIKKSVHYLPPEFIYKEFVKKRNIIEFGGNYITNNEIVNV